MREREREILPGCPVDLPDGVDPAIHVQFGSPSSSPLVFPSPSESFWQRSTVHIRPAAAKSLIKQN